MYCAWRSRDPTRYKITPAVWDRVTGFLRAAAKRSRSLAQFLDRFMPMVGCTTISPHVVTTALLGRGTITPDGEPPRMFLTELLRQADDRAVLRVVLTETVLVVSLVRERLEQEREQEPPQPTTKPTKAQTKAPQAAQGGLL